MPDQTSLPEGISSSMSTLYICTALLVIFCSLLCNLLLIFTVYGSKETRAPLDWFILNLSLGDIVSSIFAAVTTDNIQMDWRISDVFCKLSYTFVYSGYAVSVLTLCAMTSERYYGICKQVLYQKRSIAKKSKWAIPGIWVLSIALFAVYLHAYGRSEVRLVDGTTGRVCDETWSKTNKKLFYLFVPVLTLTIFPPIFMIIMFVQISRKLNVTRTPSSGGSAVLNMKRRKTTKMLVILLLVHYFCWLPTIIVKLVDAFGTTLPWYWLVLAVLDLPHYARSILYTLTYYRMYPVFRNNLWFICRSCCCCFKRESVHKTANNLSADMQKMQRLSFEAE